MAKKKKKNARGGTHPTDAARERAAVHQRRQAWIDAKLIETKTGMRNNALLLLLLTVLYGARGGHFEGLNQAIGLAMSFFAAQLIVDSVYVLRRQPKPENLARRVCVPVAIAVVIFGAMLLFLAP